MTETQKILNEGIALLEQQTELQKKINDTFDKIGVRVCSCAMIGNCYDTVAEKTIQLYSGIGQLAKELGFGLYHPRYSRNFEPYADRLAFTYGEYEIFEIVEDKDEKTV